MKSTPVTEFAWPAPQDIGPLFTMTCKNHPDLRWSTKHPTYRSVHYLGPVEITKENAKFGFKECPCKWEDLQVIEKEPEGDDEPGPHDFVGDDVACELCGGGANSDWHN